METTNEMPRQIIDDTPKRTSNNSFVLIVIIILLLISNSITAYFLLTKEQEITIDDEKIEQDTEHINEDFIDEVEQETEAEIPELQTVTVGNPVSLGEYTLTVLQILDPVEEDEVAVPLTDGYKYVAAEILLENNTSSTVFYYTNWTLYDTDGYDYSRFSQKEPEFAITGSVPVNGTSKGWINFRTVEDATSFTIKFNDETTGYSVDFMTEEI